MTLGQKWQRYPCEIAPLSIARVKLKVEDKHEFSLHSLTLGNLTSEVWQKQRCGIIPTELLQELVQSKDSGI